MYLDWQAVAPLAYRSERPDRIEQSWGRRCPDRPAYTGWAPLSRPRELRHHAAVAH